MPTNISAVLADFGLKVLIAIVILVATWLLARGIRWAFGKLVSRIRFLQRAGSDGRSLGESIGTIAALLVWLLGLIAVLQVFNLTQVITPIQAMLQNVLAFLPNLIGALFVFIVGALLAKVVRQLIEAALGAVPFDKWLGRDSAAARITGDSPWPGTGRGAAAAGPSEATGAPVGDAADAGAESGATGQPVPPAPANRVAKLIATVVYALMMIVVTIAALQILGISAISDPASHMLSSIFDAVPRVAAAVLLLGLGVLIAKFAGDLLSQVLEGFETDKVLSNAHVVPAGTSATVIIARIAQVAIVIFFAVMAAQVLEFPEVTAILQQVLTLGGQVLFGGVIIAVGFFLGNLVHRVMNGGLTATVIKYVAIVLFSAMGLKAMGIADSIIELAFGAVVVGGALAAALAFGLGGRETAARALQKLEHKASQAAEAEAAQPAATAAPAAPVTSTTDNPAAPAAPAAPPGSLDDPDRPAE